jgi:hypothetical protein
MSFSIRSALGSTTESYIVETTQDIINYNNTGAPRPGEQDWVSRQEVGNGNTSWRGIVYANDMFVVCGTSTPLIMYSGDGVSWFDYSANTLVNKDWMAIAYGNGKFVTVCKNLNGDTNFAAYTTSATTDWVPSSSGTPAVNDEERDWLDVTFGAGKFVAVADDDPTPGSGASAGYRVMYSEDGVTWTFTPAASLTNGWRGVTYGNGKFVAVSETGDGDQAMYSYDGIQWVAGTTPAGSQEWSGVCYANGLFVAVAQTGDIRVMTSIDGITWTYVDSCPSVTKWLRVRYGNGVFVAFGYSGTEAKIMTSRDGFVWTDRTAPNQSWSDGAYGKGLFVTIGFSGDNRVATSGVYES